MCQLDRQIELQTLIVRGIREEMGTNERYAMPYADVVMRVLQQHYGGERVYIPAPARRDRYQDIRNAKATGASVREICREMSVSEATVYRALSADQS